MCFKGLIFNNVWCYFSRYSAGHILRRRTWWFSQPLTSPVNLRILPKHYVILEKINRVFNLKDYDILVS